MLENIFLNPFNNKQIQGIWVKFGTVLRKIGSPIK